MFNSSPQRLRRLVIMHFSLAAVLLVMQLWLGAHNHARWWQPASGIWLGLLLNGFYSGPQKLHKELARVQ